jgi:DNA-binding XRE family transcriptional regulator
MLHVKYKNVNRFFVTRGLQFCIAYDMMCMVYHLRNREGAVSISQLAQERQARGWTQEQLAESSGVHRVTIARIETGAASPKAETLKRLADALGVLIDDLMTKEAG